MLRVAIIGTAGRAVDARSKDLNAALYEKMIIKAKELIADLDRNLAEIELISGGSAWSDHVAVSLFLTGEYGALTLYCPAPFTDKFESVPGTGTSPGCTLNFYHRCFSEKVKIDSLREIKRAVRKGATLDSSSTGFHERNSKVAKSDVVIAFTWSEGAPLGGGTGDTWKKVPKGATKIRICLDDLD